MKIYNQSGRSMIEMLGVLAIVGVLSAGGIAGYSMAMQSYKTNALIEKVQLIAQTARTVYKGNYDGISAQNLINTGKIADVSNPFGGVFNVRVCNWGTDEFVIETGSNKVPADACTDILTTDWGRTGMFTEIVVGGNESNGFWAKNMPFTMSSVVSACKGAKTIKWIFR